MITTRRLGNVHQLNFLSLVMRIFKIYSLSNFEIYRVLLIRVTTLFITSPGLIPLITGSLDLQSSFTHLKFV